MSRDDALDAIEAVYRDRFAGLVRFAQAITGERGATKSPPGDRCG